MSSSERAQNQLLWICTAAGSLAAAAAVLAVSRSLAANFNLLIYLATNTLVFVDSIDLLCRTFVMSFSKRDLFKPTSTTRLGSQVHESAKLTLFQKRLHVRPWAIAVSVFNAESSMFGFLGSIDYLRERMWIIDDGSSDGTCEYLRNTGWRCFRSDVNLKKPGAIEQLIQNLPADIETIIVIDPDIDIASRDGLGLAAIEEVIFDFQHSGLAAICPRLAIRPEGFLSKFQMLEYSLAFYGRRSLGPSCITSGISLYRRNTFAMMLSNHSKSVYAEDLENSVRLLGTGSEVGSEPRLIINTEAKTTLRGWFSQRIGWSYGLIKVYFERFSDIRKIAGRSNMNRYHYICYMGIFSLLVHPLKATSLGMMIMSFVKGMLDLLGVVTDERVNIFDPVYFLAAFGKYMVLMIITWLTVIPKGERKQLIGILPLYLLYALLQIAATAIGYLNWMTLRLFGRRLVRDHYDNGEEARFKGRRGVNKWLQQTAA